MPGRKAAVVAAQVVHFRMLSRRDAVAPTVDRVLEAVAGAALSSEQRDDLAVALAEALSNAAVHGNQLSPHALVRVEVAVVPGRSASVEVADSGHGFDHSAVSDPTEPGKILVPGGRGVFLMRRLVDELRYNDAGNQVRLTMRSRRGA